MGSLSYLNNTDKICDKLSQVFNIFRNRKDVALWWRTHPLIKSTLQAMHPEVLENYLKIEREYINECFGIYDDTGDLQRAICYSDAYYGDQSSVLNIYKHSGKPIMIENFFIE